MTSRPLAPLRHPGQLLFAGFDGLEVPGDLADEIRAGRIGGAILFARNVDSPEQVRSLVADLHALAPVDTPLCVAIDQEGGRVQRLREPWTEWPPMRELGDRDAPERTEAAGEAIGAELADLGIDLDFAPVVDVDSNPDNPVIGDRSFSRDAQRVARHAAHFIRGMQRRGVAACAKHFPGHGDTDLDSHLALPRIGLSHDRLSAVELPPFRDAIAAGVASVMTAHIVVDAIDPRHPATLSPEVLALLRDDLGYDGLVFSDDLEMAAVAESYGPQEVVERALAAGVDALLVCRRTDLREDVARALGSRQPAELEAALRRMTAFKQRWSGGRRRDAEASPPYAAHRELAAALRGTA